MLNKLNKTLNELSSDEINHFVDLLIKINQQEINNKQAKTLIEMIFNTNKSINDLIKELGFEQIKDENVLLKIIDKYISQNMELVSQYNERAERVEKFIVGMVMKETNSQANPVITINLVRQQIKKVLS